MKKVLLIDIENQPKKLKELQLLLLQYDQIILVYASSNLNCSLDDVILFSQAIQKQQLAIIKMPHAGADSADFGLTFIAGRLSVLLDKGAVIDIISNDKKLSYAVDLLLQMGMQSTHIKPIQAIESLETSAPTSKIQCIPIEPIDNNNSLARSFHPPTKIHDKLSILLRNQPKSLKSLSNGLQSWLSLDAKQALSIIEWLSEHGALIIDNNKMIYQNQQLKKLFGTVQQPHDKFTPDYIAVRPHLQRLQQYCQYLVKIKDNRPIMRAKLGNSLTAMFKLENPPQIEHLINLLKKHKIVQFDGNKIIYNDQHIHFWARIS